MVPGVPDVHPSSLDRLLADRAFARSAADAIQALASPTRLRILARLHGGPASVGDLAGAVGMEASAVSHQLRLMRHLRLVVGERSGRRIIYALHDDHVVRMIDQALAHVDHVRDGVSGRAAA